MEYYYAGIGARKTPNHVLKYMELQGKLLAEKGYILRSGGAKGADSAFERGCDFVGGPKQFGALPTDTSGKSIIGSFRLSVEPAGKNLFFLCRCTPRGY